MAAKEETFEKLRTMQDILSQKIKLERDMQEIPKILINQEEALRRVKQTYIDKNKEYEKLQADEEESRVLLREQENIREKTEASIGDISSQREYEALDKER
jgi:predicted  nucleic acid-binding Zn-ribbon protein